jgi:cytochrome P450
MTGPIVRINPYELHIDDPEFYDEVYSGPATRRDKWPWFYKLFGSTLSMFGTIPHDLHRLRRAALNPYFSKQSVTRLVPVIQSLLGTLSETFREAQKSREPVNLGVVYTALTTDVITEYSFGNPYGFLAKLDAASDFHALMVEAGLVSHLFKQFGWLFPMTQAMPTWFVALSNPQMMSLVHLENV